jgi:alginate O-acetyltransferase complex protein AlgJ
MHRAPDLSVQPAAPGDGKVVRGKDGWLFLDNDTNRTMAQHTGELRFSEGDLEDWRRVLETRRSWLADRGIRYAVLIAPNSHSIYAEQLPEGVEVVEDRPVNQLLRHLAISNASVEIVYPIDELKAARGRPVYAKTDTHWTELGAFIAYRELIEKISAWFDVPKLAEDNLELAEAYFTGDLGFKLDPPEQSLQIWVDVREPKARLIADNRVRTNGRLIEYRRDGGSGSCFVFGDSFAVRLLPLLAESFGRLVFAHITTLDRALVEREAPDVAVNVMNERFLIEVPDDRGAPTLQELAERKRGAGDMFPPIRRGLGNRVDSPM